MSQPRKPKLKVSRELLLARCACADQAELVGQAYPEGVEPTPAAMRESVEHGVYTWWGWMLLPPERQVAYALWCLPRAAGRTADPRVALLAEAAAAHTAAPTPATAEAVRVAWNAAWIAVKEADPDPLGELDHLSELLLS